MSKVMKDSAAIGAVKFGSGCGAVGRVDALVFSDCRFESHHCDLH